MKYQGLKNRGKMALNFARVRMSDKQTLAFEEGSRCNLAKKPFDSPSTNVAFVPRIHTTLINYDIDQVQISVACPSKHVWLN